MELRYILYSYIIHESGCWSPVHQKWYFLPRRASQERYNDVDDEHRATNLMITADAELNNIETKRIGVSLVTRFNFSQHMYTKCSYALSHSYVVTCFTTLFPPYLTPTNLLFNSLSFSPPPSHIPPSFSPFLSLSSPTPSLLPLPSTPLQISSSPLPLPLPLQPSPPHSITLSPSLSLSLSHSLSINSAGSLRSSSCLALETLSL